MMLQKSTSSFIMLLSISFTLTLVLASISTFVDGGTITGKVVSCPAWTLNKHKELRIFLKGESPSSSSSSAGRAKPVGEIMEYDGITIDWVRGKKAILTIYDEDGKQIKDVPLFELKTRKDMHQFMIDEGFHKKTQQEKVEEIQVERREKQLEQISDGGPSSFYNTITGLYVMVFVVLAGVAFVLRGKKKIRTGTGTLGISRV